MKKDSLQCYKYKISGSPLSPPLLPTLVHERSFSTLRRLNTWLRSSMGNSRLSNLARIHIHRDRAQCLPRERIVKIFVHMHPRALEYSIVEGQILLNCSFLIIRYFFELKLKLCQKIWYFNPFNFIFAIQCRRYQTLNSFGKIFQV